ncbi:MAG: aspartate kinase [Patescibacteria group bacterium]|nr:aspartate kinase [Patescibacteria group bacterium]MDD5294367.1 aspartate kinase [Patescibacteria group bacterium]MDD5554189.1 aspartate kinase [Patescibacteria group bacterium]
MSLIVQKCGGTSVATPEKIGKVADHIRRCRENGNDIVVVVSAMGEETDRLIDLAKGISPNPDEREMDQLLQTGEVVSAALLAMALNGKGTPAKSLTAAQIGLVAAGEFGKARIKSLKNRALIRNQLKQGKVVIIAGFQGISEKGLDIITLGRGGSDTTAVALAAFLKAKVCEIYTDVDGVYTIDPRLVPNARRFDIVSYEQMIAMSVAGAGVLMDRAVILAKMYGVKIRVLVSPSIKESTGGTLVTATSGNISDLEKTADQSGIAIKKEVGCIHVFGIPDEPGKAAEISSPLEKINVIDIAQSRGAGTAQISFLLDVATAEKVFPNMEKMGGAETALRQGLVAISLVDLAMKETANYFRRIAKVLGDNGINIEFISTSQTGITMAISDKYLNKAAQALAREFDLLSS